MTDCRRSPKIDIDIHGGKMTVRTLHGQYGKFSADFTGATNLTKIGAYLDTNFII
jgi:hypothetical protein